MTQGDLLFLYHTKNAGQQIAALQVQAEERLRELERRGWWRIWGAGGRERKRLTEMVALLKRAANSSALYSKMDACARTGTD